MGRVRRGGEGLSLILEGQRHRRVRASDKETARLVERVIAAARLVHPSPSRLPSCPSPNTCNTFRFPPCGVVVISIDGEGNPSRNGQTLKRETLSNGSRSLIRRGEKKEKLTDYFPLCFLLGFSASNCCGGAVCLECVR